MRVAVASHTRIFGVDARGKPFKGWTPDRGEPTYDWRADPGSAENTAGISAEWSVVELGEALARRYRTDAHLVTYYVVGPDGLPLERQPRVNKGGLPWLLEQGYSVEHDVLMVDVDNPLHVEWTEPGLARFYAFWADPPEVLRTCGVYITFKGYRLLQPPDEPVAASEAERYLAAWIDELCAVGIEPDKACCDWTRLFRLPHIRRPFEYSSPLVDLGRMQPRHIVPKARAGSESRLAEPGSLDA